MRGYQPGFHSLDEFPGDLCRFHRSLGSLPEFPGAFHQVGGDFPGGNLVVKTESRLGEEFAEHPAEENIQADGFFGLCRG